MEALKVLEKKGDAGSSQKRRLHLPESMVRATPLQKIYSILECISKSSPGTVYIVQDSRDEKKYVLKKIECHDESDAAKAFFEEMELKRLDHPYVSSYRDFFVSYEKEDSSMFINSISDYFESGNLREYIRSSCESKEVIPEETVQKMAGEMFEGLKYIHEKGLIHRCIKPSNIFLKPNDALVLGDLGVSTVMSDMRTNTRSSFQNTVYLAPETSSGPHREKSDYYSLACVLLQLATTSFLDEKTFLIRLRDMKEDQEILNQLFDKISQNYSKPLINLLQSLLKTDPALRPGALDLEKNSYVNECMVQVDSSQLDKRSRQKQTKSSQNYALTESRKDIFKVLEYIADTIDHEDCVADGLNALSEIVRDNDQVHKSIDQKARNLISLAMWDNIFNKEVQIAGCYVLSNLVIYSEPDDILFSPDVITIIHKIMTSHEYEADVQLAAVNLIVALSTEEKASKIIVQLGGIQDILNAMRVSSFHATLCAVCCMALWSLTIQEENLKIAIQNNAVRDIGKALNTHKISPDVCEAVAAALISLLLDDSSYEPFNELDCVGNLVSAINLHTKNAKVVHNCCKVLATVVEANEECAFRFLTSDNPDDENPTGIPTVMEAYRLHKDDALVVESIVRLLLELSNYEDINVEMQAALVGPLVLSEVHKRYKENRDIMGPVEEALDRLGAGFARAHKNSAS